MGGKPDALIAGQNSEISNRLTMQRRPGLLQFGVSNVPTPDFIGEWQLATTSDIIIIVDTNNPGGDNNVGPYGGLLNYSTTHSGVYFNKSISATQTNIEDVVNTLYCGDGVDLFKITGPNLLSWSNTYTMQPPWVAQGITLTPNQSDPLNGTAATQITWTGNTNSAFDGATGNAQFSGSALPGPFPIGTLTPTGSNDIGIVIASAVNNANLYANLTIEGPTGWTNFENSGSGNPYGFYQTGINSTTSTALNLTGTIFDYYGCYILLHNTTGGSPAVSNVTSGATISGNGNTALAYGSNVTAGDVLLTAIQLSSNGTSPANTVSDSLGNTYQLLDVQTITNDAFAFNRYIAIYGTVTTSSGANTVTVNTSGFTAGTGDFWIAEVSGVGGTPLLSQTVTPQYTPVATNTFTASAWLRYESGPNTVTLEILDQSGMIVSHAFPLTSTWTKYQITGTMLASSNVVTWELNNPTTTNMVMIYGAQLEIGGPATTTQITTTKGQGVWLWGIDSPKTAPSFTTQQAVGNTGQPWQANHAYNVGDTIVDTNGNLEYATNGGIYPELDLTLTSVNNAGVYSGTITNGANNRYAGLEVTTEGFTNPANNGLRKVTASTSSTITTNAVTVMETHAGTARFGVVGTPAGTSGASQPTWNTQVNGFTIDGAQNLVVQKISTPVPAAANNASVTFVSPVTAGNMLIVAIYVSHPQVLSITDTVSDVFVSGLTAGHGGSNPGGSGETRNNAVSSGQFSMYLYYVVSAVGGNTTINVTGGGNTGTYIAAAELQDLTGADTPNFNSNAVASSASTTFTTGGINTSNATDIIFTVGAFAVSTSAGASAEIGSPPATYVTVNSDGPASIASNTALVNITMAFLNVANTGFYDPNWTIASPTNKSQNLGITGGFKTNVGTLEWINLGHNGAGLTATIGYQWYYSYGNSYTGHFSNVSPISVSSGPITGQDVFVTGNTRPMINPGPTPAFTPGQWVNRIPWQTDPQSDMIAVYRNTDGGGFFYQVALFGNGAAAQATLIADNYPGLTITGVTYTGNTWTYEDITPDTSINTLIFAPIGLLNSLPPVGLKDMDYFAGRMWASVANIQYYNTSADNASLLSVLQNGVPSESWIPTNFIPYNSGITRNLAVGGGLLTETVTDTWFVTGQNLLTGGFNPQKSFAGHGVRSYNASGLDGSSVFVYTSDRQILLINPNSGSVEFGFPIGDFLENTFDPTNAYVVRHVAGSQDNAVYITDAIGTWIRLNPNQQGASMSGEQTPVFSPPADFTATLGGISAIASIETAAGVHKLLVGSREVSVSGLPVAGPILVRDLNTFTDNGIQYTWTGTIGSILLATPGKIANAESVTTEMNNCSGTAGSVSANAGFLQTKVSL